MSLWNWIYQFIGRAEAAGDTLRADLFRPFQDALELFETDPDQAFGLLAEGRQAAQQLREAWWILFYEHWQMQVLLFYKPDLKAALDMSVRCAVETRKETYAQFPQRVCLHEDLINAYMGSDPAGYADQIVQALDYIQAEVTPDVDCRFCLQGMRVEFALLMRRLDEAERETAIYTAMTQRTGHYLTAAHTSQCSLSYLRQQWDSLLGWAQAGEALARRHDKPQWLLEFLAWQAFALQKTGQSEAAQRIFRSIMLQEKRLGAVPTESYFTALSTYHEISGEYSEAMEVRRRQLATLVGKGKTQTEVECRLHILRLLQQMGLPLGEEMTAARDIAAQLVDPSRYLAEFDQLSRGV
ncbi:MAG: hypothetical protein ABI947_26945 [Chloroflexota bacterium]